MLCRPSWVLEAVEIIPHPPAKRSITTVGPPCRYPLDALTCTLEGMLDMGGILHFGRLGQIRKVYSAFGPLPGCLSVPCIGWQQLSGSETRGMHLVGGVRGSG